MIDGPLSIGGYAPLKVLPFIRLTGGAPAPSGADPTGHSLLLRKLLTDVYEKTAVILEPVDYLGLRFTGRGGGDAGVDDRILAHRQPSRARRWGTLTRSSPGRAVTAPGCPSHRNGFGARPLAARRRVRARRRLRGLRWSAGSRICTPP